MRQLHSPNFGSRDNHAVSLLVLHYTGMKTGAAAISRLCEEAAKVSAHYVVEEDGNITQLVDEQYNAWHAGVSFWRGHQNVNNISVGVEIVNPGHEWGYRPFPTIQMHAVAELCGGIVTRHRIAARNVVAHSDIAPERKEDPGELFDWPFLAQKGIGLWPADTGQGMQPGRTLQKGDCGEEIGLIQQQLAEYGYKIPQNQVFDEATQKVIIAFQRHFRPRNLDGAWDNECKARLAGLLAML
jgi:N-acetylmuramoyl-L-alanine amidase